MKKQSKWDIKGYFCIDSKGNWAIMIPKECENCKDKKPLHKTEVFETFQIKTITFKA